MSRLFEALSSLHTDRHPRKAAPRAATVAEMFPPDVTGWEVPPLVPAKPVEAENPSAHAPREKLVPPDGRAISAAPSEAAHADMCLTEDLATPGISVESRAVELTALPESRLVALTDPKSLGAEKFRALVARLDDMHERSELKSFQVTSSMINEGKSFVAGNAAVTLARYSGSKTLLIEGDLHRPSLATQFGLNELCGLSHWWSGQDRDLGRFIHKLHDMPLWFLAAGKPCDGPSDLLRSERFAAAFRKLASRFEWIVVDSTPMLPIVDVNLWSKLVDGTLLVVRQGITPVKVLKKGLQALDRPKLIGVVINEESGSDQMKYEGKYYSAGT